MNQILLLLSVCLLAGCGEMKPIHGAPEVIVHEDCPATVAVQPDGSRLITIRTGEVVRVIILLPPAKSAGQATTAPAVEKVEKTEK